MWPLVFFLLFFSAAALANVPGYDLSLGAEVRGGTLKVAPTVPPRLARNCVTT